MKRNRSKAKPGSQVASLLNNWRLILGVLAIFFALFVVASLDVTWGKGSWGVAQAVYGGMNWILEILAILAIIWIIFREPVGTFFHPAGHWVRNFFSSLSRNQAISIGVLLLVIILLAIGIVFVL